VVLNLKRARVRIALLAGVVSFVCLATVALVTRSVVRADTFDHVDDALDTLVEAIGSDIELRGLQDLRRDALREGLENNVFEFRLEHHSAILCRGTEVLASTGDLPRSVAPASLLAITTRGARPFTAREEFTGQRRICRFQVARLSGQAEGATLVVFRSIDPTLHALAAFDRALLAMVLVGAVLSGVILVLATRQALLPVERITAAAQEIGAHDLSRRVPGGSGAEEFGRLAAVVNGLLERLERAFAAQRRLAADAAHELKTPAAVIVAETQEALRDDASPAERARSLDSVLNAARGLAIGVDDLLELTRSESPDDLRRESVALGDLVEEVTLAVGPLAASLGVTVEFAVAEEVALVGDRLALGRALANLVRNAVQYSPAGGRVDVVGDLTGDVVRLEVRDRGPGVPESERRRVFERFVRLPDGRSRNPQGSGLGLAIVAEIVRRHQGTVTVAGRDGGGAVFRVELPRS
jgi:signal transduction histidine kinase